MEASSERSSSSVICTSCTLLGHGPTWPYERAVHGGLHECAIRYEIIVVCLICAVVAASSPASTEHSVPVLTNITLTDRTGKSVRVTALAVTAREYLYQKAPETRTNRDIGQSVWIDCSGKQPSFRFTFFGKVGDREYHVTLDSNGRLKEYRANEYEADMN